MFWIQFASTLELGVELIDLLTKLLTGKVRSDLFEEGNRNIRGNKSSRMIVRCLGYLLKIVQIKPMAATWIICDNAELFIVKVD